MSLVDLSNACAERRCGYCWTRTCTHQCHGDEQWDPTHGWTTPDPPATATTTPGPWRVHHRPDGVTIIVGAATDGDHTVCEVRPCDDHTHPGRVDGDAELIVALRNQAADRG